MRLYSAMRRHLRNINSPFLKTKLYKRHNRVVTVRSNLSTKMLVKTCFYALMVILVIFTLIQIVKIFLQIFSWFV